MSVSCHDWQRRHSRYLYQTPVCVLLSQCLLTLQMSLACPVCLLLVNAATYNLVIVDCGFQVKLEPLTCASQSMCRTWGCGVQVQQ